MKLEEARKLRERRAVITGHFSEEFKPLMTKVENGRQMSQAEKVILIEKRNAESRLPRISDLENRINALPLRAINLDRSPWRRNSDVDGMPWWRNTQKMLTLFLAVVAAIIILILTILFSVDILPGKASNTTTISTSHIL